MNRSRNFFAACAWVMTLDCQPAGVLGRSEAMTRAILTGPVGASNAARADSAPDAGGEDDIEIFLDVARTDAAPPYPSAYVRAAAAAGVDLTASSQPSNLGKPSAAWVAAEALSKSSDPRARDTLASWAARAETLPAHRRDILTVMDFRAEPEYLEAVKAILANDAIAKEPGGIADLGLYSEAVGTYAYVSNWMQALDVASNIETNEASDFVRAIAMDRNRSAPDPRIYASLPNRCCHGNKGFVKDEAAALASLRIVALALLRERWLVREIAQDRKEPALVRNWASAMANPDRVAAAPRHDWGKPPDYFSESFSPCAVCFDFH